jgi:flagellar basal-body rod protein FlgC
MSLFSALSVSGSGMTAQRTRAELLVENMANVETTRTPDGGPYRRKDVTFESQPVGSFDDMVESELGYAAPGTLGVRVSEVVVDQRDPEKRYLPGHPDADKDGYVAFPRINPAEDMVDLVDASRNFEANVSAISAVKDMIQQSIAILG